MQRIKLLTIILITIIIAILAFLIFRPREKEVHIEDGKEIANYLDTLKEPGNIKTHSIALNPNTLKITYEDGIYSDYYKHLEQNAALLFNKITDLNIITFDINDGAYVISLNQIKTIFNGEITTEKIEKRYTNNNFTSFIYIGNIKGQYDLFDKSDECGITYLPIFEDSNYIYQIICSSADQLYAISEFETIKLKDALEQGKITVDELFQTELKIIKEAKK